jgi:hypothetical protein
VVNCKSAFYTFDSNPRTGTNPERFRELMLHCPRRLRSLREISGLRRVYAYAEANRSERIVSGLPTYPGMIGKATPIA